MENTADFYELFSNLATYGAFMPIPQEPLLEECQSEENAYTECGKEKESREHARNVETVARLIHRASRDGHDSEVDPTVEP